MASENKSGNNNNIININKERSDGRVPRSNGTMGVGETAGTRRKDSAWNVARINTVRVPNRVAGIWAEKNDQQQQQRRQHQGNKGGEFRDYEDAENGE
ncbi:unnamed protein product [Lampetra fluviatilis]